MVTLSPSVQGKLVSTCIMAFLVRWYFANGNHFAITPDGDTGKDGRFCSYNHAANKSAVRGDVAVGIKMDIV